jgi:AraC-like DNA-binding protein
LDFTNPASVRRPEVIAPWHEIVVCLGGECIVTRGREAAGRLLTAGTVVGLNPGERYAEEHFAAESGALVVLGLRDLEALGIADFVFPEGAIDDEAFVAAVRELTSEAAADGEARPEAIVELLRSFIERHGKPVPTDRLFAVKREIDRNPHAPLYVAQLAEMASMHPETFTRAFARRFGITPIRYRLHRRLLEAAHLLLTEPHMLVSDVATRVGFEDLRFFHRSFRGRCGISPAAYRQWFSEAAQGRRRASGIPPKTGTGSSEAAA